MKFMPRFPAAVRWLILVCLAIIPWTGCLTSWDRVFLRYDEKSDRFRFLNLYTHFAAESLGEAEYLHQRWRNREHLISTPFPTLGSKNWWKVAFVRLPGDQVASIPMDRSPDELQAGKSPVQLDSVHVLPGAFFQTPADGLCYYEQVEVPGPFVDDLLAWVQMEVVRPKVIEAIIAELRPACQRRSDRVVAATAPGITGVDPAIRRS